MRALVTLCPAESKLLIARAVARLPQVRAALKHGVLVIGTGTTNAQVAEACTGIPVDGSRFVAGMITRGLTCVTPRDERKPNLVLVRGEAQEITPLESLELEASPKVLVKGANAVDPSGVAGVLMASADGGTVGRLLGHFQAGGWPIIIPVGLEKLIPSVVLASQLLGHDALDRSLGVRVGLMPLSSTHLITEVAALRTLGPLTVTQVAAGGVAGSEGSVTLVIDGDAADVEAALAEIEGVKGVQTPPPVLSTCAECGLRCDYSGRSRDQLPRYLAG
ncbi:MAG: hypothetical protein ABI333_19340 [bacterium]